MPRNGAGTFNPPASTWNPGVNGVTATTADYNAQLTDISAAITQSISADGQTPMTGNLPMGNNKITGLAAGTANTDAVNFTQQTGRLLGVQVFAANGTYTPTAGTTTIIVEAVGAGGGGGGCVTTGAGQLSIGGGGGAGGYVKSRITSGFSGQAVVAGTAGVGQNGLGGTAGTASTFMTISAGGGGGGNALPVTVAAVVNGGGGGVASGGNLLNIVGNAGQTAMGIYANSVWLSGPGASSIYGSGPVGVAANTTVSSGASGNTASGGYGIGGGGAASGPSTGIRPGGNGTSGVVIIYEYA